MKHAQGEELVGTGGKAGSEGSNNGACVTFLDSVTAVTGMADGSLIVWAGSSAVKVLGKAHTGRVNQLCPAGPFLVSGGRDGKVHVWTLTKEGSIAAPPGGGKGGYGRRGAGRGGGEKVGRTVVALASTIDGDEVCRKIDLMHETAESMPKDTNGRPYRLARLFLLLSLEHGQHPYTKLIHASVYGCAIADECVLLQPVG